MAPKDDNTDPVVYRSSHPDVVGTITDWIEQRPRFTEQLHQVAADIDPDAKGRKMAAFEDRRRAYALGLEVLPEDIDHPPAGWRIKQAGNVSGLVPIRREKAAREIYDRIEALVLPRPWPPGMPSESWSFNGPVYLPGHRFIDGTVYVIWNGNADLSVDRLMSDGRTVDPDLWERCPLSVYYAAVEADEAESDD